LTRCCLERPKHEKLLRLPPTLLLLAVPVLLEEESNLPALLLTSHGFSYNES
jgi:hypothetical protein